LDSKVIDAISQLEEEKAILATIISTKGSTPRKAGSQVLFFPDGRVIGTIGGGCGEAEVRRHAFKVLESGKAALLVVDLTHDVAEQDGMVCGGTMEVFLEPIG
jgi:xanthine/CO dehydrogenase XdhC/CoxF family maturation factor